MSMGMYRTLFYVGLILAVAFLIASIVLFFVLKIPKAFGVVTGRTQKRAIEEIRAGGYEAKSKREALQKSGRRIHVREVEMDTGALHKGQSGPITREKTGSPDSGTGGINVAETKESVRPNRDRSKAYEQTEVLDFTGDLAEQTGKLESDDTEILGRDEGDGFTGEEQTDILGGRTESGLGATADDELETDVLIGRTSVPEDEEIVGRYSAEETAVLRSMHVTAEEEAKPVGEIRVLYAETIVHTDETLQ